MGEILRLDGARSYLNIDCTALPVGLQPLRFFYFFIGYRYYSKFFKEKIYRLNPEDVTSAHQFNDGVD